MENKLLVPFQVYEGPAIQVSATLRGRLPDGRPLYLLTERFLVRNQYLGEVVHDWMYTNNERLSQTGSTAFFCQLCGDIWARRVITPEWWRSYERRCERHGDGSLLLPGEDDVLDDWPLALITYEFILATKDL